MYCLVWGVYLPGPRGLYLPGPRGVYLPGLGGCTCLVWGVYLPGPGWSVPAWSWGVYLVWGWGGGVPAGPRGVPGPGGCTWSGGCTCLVLGVPGQVLPPWTEFLTHASEIITLAKTSFRPVINYLKSEPTVPCLFWLFKGTLQENHNIMQRPSAHLPIDVWAGGKSFGLPREKVWTGLGRLGHGGNSQGVLMWCGVEARVRDSKWTSLTRSGRAGVKREGAHKWTCPG